VLIIILISNEMLSRSEHMYCNVKLNYLGFGNLGVHVHHLCVTFHYAW